MTPPLRTLFLLMMLAACSRDTSSSTPGSPAMSAPAAPVTSAMPAASGARATDPSATVVALPVRQGKSTFLIDAPLEKIKGEVGEARGEVRLDPADLTRTRGEVSFRVTSLRTATFDDASKNESQTDHARNWLQVGSKSGAAERERHEWATFRVMSVAISTNPSSVPVRLDGSQPLARLADLPVEADGSRLVRGQATGDLTLHGVTRSQTLVFQARVSGPAQAPTGLTLTTDRPFDLSMREYDVKPRDDLGSFLAGALEKIGQKISDRIQVSLEVKAGS